MKLECVIVCVGYADFLANTLPYNKELFDRTVVVTTADDKATQRICEYWHVKVVCTDAFGIEHGDFRKGAGINVGLTHLELDGWVLHLDADIVLPPLTRDLLERANLDPSMLYGIDRHNIQSYGAWAAHIDTPALQQEDQVYVHLNPYPVATRFMWPASGGYMPIGFFQLWNPNVSGVDEYPDKHTDAGRTDMLFSSIWPRSKRALFPEIVGYHLESEAAPQGTNWNGRKTIPFEPAPARERCWRRWWRKHHHRWRRRRHHHRHHPYFEGMQTEISS